MTLFVDVILWHPVHLISTFDIYSISRPQSECFNIDIPDGDPLRDSGRSCLPLIRALEATDILCKKGKYTLVKRVSD